MESEAILVVDDHPDLRTIYRAVLEHAGYLVIEAADGQEALRHLLQPSGERIRLVVSDVVMPKFGGRELLSRTAELFPDLPVVLLSGLVPEDCAYTGTDLHASAFLRKPIEPQDLVRAVRDLLVDRAEVAHPPAPASAPASGWRHDAHA